eukprot:c9579_g1_i1.p1 GENE.c9579_g1_i1~~c9579_g1_i1.p1  ORF type:complete len:594 (+),score=149.23 c9579_g1_i1:89-1870(+)
MRFGRKRQLIAQAQHVKSQRDQKIHSCFEGIASENDIFPPDTVALVIGASALELRELMASKKVTCEGVVKLFAFRAFVHGRDTNAVTEEMYSEAVARAKEVDQLPEDAWQDREKFPLLGVPVSIKEHFEVANTLSTCGLAARCFAPDTNDGLLVTLLREAGAIPFVKTNVPQCLMLPNSANNIWGTASNPWDLERTPGGSSGGEGALIALRASPLGVGTDIGGSIRIPALFCGICGFKPTPSRITALGYKPPKQNDRSGQTMIRCSAGPLAHTIDDLAALTRVWMSPLVFARDPTVMPLPFNTQVYEKGTGKTLRVGYFTTDAWFQPCTAAVRAVEEAVEAMKALGHTIEEIEIPPAFNGWEASKLFFGLMGADGNMDEFMRALDGEMLHRDYTTIKKLTDIPNFARPLIHFVLGKLGEQRKQHLSQGMRSGGLAVRQYWQLVADLEAYRSNWIHFVQSRKLDVIIAPGMALPAFQHDLTQRVYICCSTTFMMNLLHWPACAVPITVVRESEQDYPMHQLPNNQRDEFSRFAADVLEGAEGMPMGVQVIALPHMDELCLHAAKQIHEKVQFSARPNLSKGKRGSTRAPIATKD